MRTTIIAAGFLALAASWTAAPALAQPHPPADPTTFQSYPCHYIQNWVWNFPGDGVGNVTGQVRFPSETCDSADGPPAGRPLVVFAHGNAMDHTDHRYLMAHLARNGFVTASIANGGDNETRARQIISFLNSMHTFWGWSARLSNLVAFAGHSRGGEAAVTAARLLDEDPTLAAENYDVRAVVSIAPTDGGMIGDEPREELTGAAADGFLALYGTRDSDVQGSEAVEGQNLVPQRTAWALYDRAGSEFSSEGLVIAGVHVAKAFVSIYGMGHRAFLDDDQFGSTPAGRNVASAYLNAFLRWKVFSESIYRGFFDGTWRPDALADLELFQQLSDGTRRVVDNFEDGDPDANTIGSTVTTSADGIITFLDGPLHELVKSSPHDSSGLRVTWVAPSWVRWGIPNTDVPFVGPKRDVSDYTHLSLRVAQIYGNTYNTEGQDQDFQVRLFTGAGFSVKVPVSLHGRVPYPDPFICDGPALECGFDPPNDYSKSGATTLRIPLSAFAGADLTNVVSVYLYFDVPERPQGAITIDNLELVH